MWQMATGNRRPRVVVVGAGFGGLAAARRLTRAPVDVLVVDRTNHHLFQPLLYQVATGILPAGEIAPPIRGIFRRDRRTSVLLAEVTGLDLGRREVLARGVDGTPHRLGYDYLVVAAGARDSYFGHEDWARHLFPMKTLAQAVALRDRILAAYEQAVQAWDDQAWWTTFVIVGAGPTGVELAGQLATIARQFHRDFRRIDTERARIVVVEAGPQILPAFARPLREHAGRKLAAMGVQIRLGCEAVHVDEDGIDIRTRDGGRERIRARTVVWAAGVKASPLGKLLGEATGAAVDRKGRVAVGPDCTLPGHPEVFAIGDVAALGDLPGLCEPAMQEGWYVARLIRSRLAGDPPPGPVPLPRPGHYGHDLARRRGRRGVRAAPDRGGRQARVGVRAHRVPGRVGQPRRGSVPVGLRHADPRPIRAGDPRGRRGHDRPPRSRPGRRAGPDRERRPVTGPAPAPGGSRPALPVPSGGS